MKKVLAVVMMIVMLVCGTSTVYAAQIPEDIVSPNYNMIKKINLSLDISSSGLAEIEVNMTGTTNTANLQIITYLEKKVGSSWERVDLGIANDWWHDIVEGTYLSETHQFQLSSRGTYRAVGCFSAFGDLPYDYTEKYTGEKTY